MDINLTGVLHGTSITMTRMGKDEGGGGELVVNGASILGLFCGTQPKGYQYNTSKSAVVTLSRCIANKIRICITLIRLYLCTCTG